MGREQLDRTKRFTDDGKLRGIISSAKFVPECREESEYVGFGQLFKYKGAKDEDIERELNVIDDEKVSRKRRIDEEINNVKILDTSKTQRTVEGNKRKRCMMVVLKIPKSGHHDDETRKRRRVQFADV